MLLKSKDGDEEEAGKGNESMTEVDSVLVIISFVQAPLGHMFAFGKAESYVLS
jgi:hypothetical protein